MKFWNNIGFIKKIQSGFISKKINENNFERNAISLKNIIKIIYKI